MKSVHTITVSQFEKQLKIQEFLAAVCLNAFQIQKLLYVL